MKDAHEAKERDHEAAVSGQSIRLGAGHQDLLGACACSDQFHQLGLYAKNKADSACRECAQEAQCDERVARALVLVDEQPPVSRVLSKPLGPVKAHRSGQDGPPRLFEQEPTLMRTVRTLDDECFAQGLPRGGAARIQLVVALCKALEACGISPAVVGEREGTDDVGPELLGVAYRRDQFHGDRKRLPPVGRQGEQVLNPDRVKRLIAKCKKQLTQVALARSRDEISIIARLAGGPILVVQALQVDERSDEVRVSFNRPMIVSRSLIELIPAGLDGAQKILEKGIPWLKRGGVEGHLVGARELFHQEQHAREHCADFEVTRKTHPARFEREACLLISVLANRNPDRAQIRCLAGGPWR